jgi:hypothetical protein
MIKKPNIKEFEEKQAEVTILRGPIKKYLEKKYIPAEKLVPFLTSQGITGVQGVQGIKGEDSAGGPGGISGNFDGGEPDTPVEDTLILDFGEI